MVNRVIYDFNDTVSVVSGGYQGIGKAIVNRLLESGSRVYSIDPRYNMTQNDYRKGNLVEFKGFTNSDVDMKAFLNVVNENENRVDFLINNAGIYLYKNIEQSTSDDFKTLVDVNLKGYFNMIKYFLPLLKKSTNPAIVNIASVSGQRTEKGHPIYSMTKGGILALTKAVAADLGDYKIRINSVSPGNIETPMNDDDIKVQAKLRGISPLEVEKEYAEGSILKRRGKPEEVANVVLFLLSEGASYINAEDIVVDGGLFLI